MQQISPLLLLEIWFSSALMSVGLYCYPSNARSRSTELDLVDRWAQNNNYLRLNRAKSTEIIFTNSKRKHAEGLPPQIPDIRRVTSIKMLGVIITNHICPPARPAIEHVRNVIGKCAQSLQEAETAALPRHERRLVEVAYVYKAVVLASCCMLHPHGGVLPARPTNNYVLTLEASIYDVLSGLYNTADDPTLS